MRFVALLILPLLASAQNFQVSGIVVDHLTNRPLNHILVDLVASVKDGGSVSAVTESDGRFSFTAVPKGKYRLTAQRRGETPQGFHQDSGFGTALIVGSGASAENLIFPLRANGSISGIVTDEQGDPVSRAQVHIYMQSVVNGELQTTQNRTTNTNSAGEFHAGRLRPGTYFVAVMGRPWYSTAGQFNPMKSPPGLQANGTDLVYPLTWYGNTSNGEAASPMVLAEGASLNVQISVHSVPSIHAQLAAPVAPAPRESDGVNIFVRGPGNVRVPIMSMTTINGNVRELTGLAAGRYEVVLRSHARLEDEPASGRSETLDMTDGMTLPEPPAGHLAVSGQVKFASGDKPESDVQVSLNSNGQSAVTRLGDDSTFVFINDRLGAGSYHLYLNTPGLWIESFTVKGAKRVGETVELPASGNVTLSIIAATAGHLGKLQGVAMLGDATYPGAMVLLLPQDLDDTKRIRRDQTDSDGSFTLSGIVPGRYTLIAIDNGSGLLYKTASIIKPYLSGGLSVTVSPQNVDPLKINVQKRLQPTL